jgi:hypothetical protein
MHLLEKSICEGGHSQEKPGSDHALLGGCAAISDEADRTHAEGNLQVYYG